MNNRRQGRGKSRLLTQTSYIYDGKVKNPAVKVFDSKGKQLSSNDYTVSKSSGRKNVGNISTRLLSKMDIQVKRHYTLRSNQNQHPLHH